MLGSRTEGREDKGWAVGVPVVLESPEKGLTKTLKPGVGRRRRPFGRPVVARRVRPRGGVKCAHWVGGREEGRQGQERDTTGRPGWVPCLRVRLEGGPELGPFCHRLRASIGFHNPTVPLQPYCLVIWFLKKGSCMIFDTQRARFMIFWA